MSFSTAESRRPLPYGNEASGYTLFLVLFICLTCKEIRIYFYI